MQLELRDGWLRTGEMSVITESISGASSYAKMTDLGASNGEGYYGERRRNEQRMYEVAGQ